MPHDYEYFDGSTLSVYKLLLVSLFTLLFVYLVCTDKSYDDHLPIVNRLFAREPHFLSRLRWALWARRILDNAHKEVST